MANAWAVNNPSVSNGEQVITFSPVIIGANVGDYFEMDVEAYTGNAGGNYRLAAISDTGFLGILEVAPTRVLFRPNDGSNIFFDTGYVQPSTGQRFTIRVERASAGVWECFLDGVSLGTASSSLNFPVQQMMNFQIINGEAFKGLLYKAEASSNGGIPTNRWINTEGPTGSILTDEIGGNYGTLASFANDGTQWVLYDDGPAGGVTADSAFTLPAVAVASNAAATLPQPDALASFTLPAVEMASIASATLPQPSASGAFTLPAYAISATADATQPNPIASGAFNLSSLTFSASASATSPAFESVVAFTLPGLAVEGQASATQPNPTASGFFTLPSLQVQANGTVTLPQPSASGAFTLPALDFSGNASVTEPVFTASGAFALPALTMTGQASATQPQPSASGAFNLPALRVNGNITVSGIVIQAGSEGTLYLDAGSNVIYVNAGDNTLHLH